MAGIAIIVPGADFSQNNLGRVNLITEDAPLMYIRAGKTSVINTNLLPSSQNNYEIKVKADSISQFFGSRNNTTYTLTCYNSGKDVMMSGYETITKESSFANSIFIATINSESVVIKNESAVTIGTGSRLQANPYTNLDSITYPMLLFGMNLAGSYTTDYRCCIYYFKIKDGQGNVIHNFIPYVSVTGVPYFLDTITNEKYHFEGSDDIFYSVDGVNEITYKMPEV